MNQPPASLNVFEQIERVCRDFRRQLKRGDQPTIECFLKAFDDEAKTTIFRNLLQIEIEYRRQQNEQPTAEQYIKRFPGFARLIRQAFFQSTMMSMPSLHSTPADGPTASLTSQSPDASIDQTFAMPAANRLGDYLLVRELGRGGFGVVYEAQHVQRGNRVALKTLPTGGQRAHALDDAERLHKFRREFRSLADMNHPNLIGMQTLEVDGSQWFFTMDLIDGDDFLSYVRPDENLDESRLRAVLPQLVSGIMALHGQHIVHRDLKPSNVLITDDGRVTILDFGLVAELGEHGTDQTASLSMHFAGTPRYAAPEQMFGQKTPATDWYALGVMLYEALTGSAPHGGSLAELMESKRNQDAPQLAGRDGLPQDLADLADGLLRRDPEQRLDPLSIASTLSVEVNTSQTGSVSGDSIVTGESGQVMIGRERQLAELEAAKDRLMETREPQVVFITGRSGEGKTFLATQFLQSLGIDDRILVLAGRCYDRESVPFKAIDSLIDALVAALRAQKTEDIIKLIPNDIQMLVQLFPVLSRVEAIANWPSTIGRGLDAKQVQRRAFNALREFLLRISQRTPIVVFIDDLQWGDADSADELIRLLQPPDPPVVLLLGSYRMDEAEESSYLKRWEAQHASVADRAEQRISVGPLSESQCIELVVARIGQDTEMIRQHARQIYQSTGGNPYFLDQLIDCFHPDTGSFSPAPLNEVIETKLSRLPNESATLLNAIAVSGQASRPEEICLASGQDNPAFATITHMITERLLRQVGTDQQQLIDTYHDKIRETVVDQLDGAERRRIHRDIGEAIETQVGVSGDDLLDQLNQDPNAGHDSAELTARVFDLSYHFDEAQVPGKAVAYSLLAAEKAKAQFALDMAIAKYKIAQRHLDGGGNPLRFRIESGIGEALLLTGSYDPASEALTRALPFARSDPQRFMVRALLARIVYILGSTKESIQTYENLLRELGHRIPRSQFGFRTGGRRNRLISQIRNWLPKNWLRKKTAIDEQTSLSIQLLVYAAYPSYYADYARALWYSFYLLRLARRYHGIADVAIALHVPSVGQGMFLGWSRGQFLADEAIQLAENLDDLQLQADGWFFRTGTMRGIGRFDEAVESSKRAVELYSKIGNAWRILVTQIWEAGALARLGDYVEGARLARDLFGKAIHSGAQRLAPAMLETWAHCIGGDLPFQQLRSCFEPAKDDICRNCQLLVAEALWCRQHADYPAALKAIQTAEEMLHRHRYLNGEVSIVYPGYARALREQADHLEKDGNLNEAVALRKRAHRAAKHAVRLSREMPHDLPFALRELALSTANDRKLRKALKFAGESCQVAEKQNAKHEYAKSLLVSGQLGKRLGLPNSQQQIEQANELLADFERLIEEAKRISINTPSAENS